MKEFTSFKKIKIKMVMKNKENRDVTIRTQPNLENWTRASSILTSKWKQAALATYTRNPENVFTYSVTML